jgi:hypothetical protein
MCAMDGKPPGRILFVVILLIATAPLWLWALDSLLHFGYTGDRP